MSRGRFILASTSPRRRELLAATGFDFEVAAPPQDDNHQVEALAPARLALSQARAKAAAVAAKREGEIVLAADTVVVLDGKILGKPADLKQARAMLEALSGRVHQVLTGCCLWRGGRVVWEAVVESEVEFRRLFKTEIEAYLAAGSPLDKAGAYGIQDLGGGLVKAIKGSYTNIVGLPMAEVIEALAQEGVWARGGAG